MEEIKNALQQLHFEKALWLLQQNQLQDPILFSQALRGLFRLSEALSYAQKGVGTEGRMEEIKCLFAVGKIEEAQTILEELEPHQQKKAAFQLLYASLLGEIGQVRLALKKLELLKEEELEGSAQIEYHVLKADLLSFQEKNSQAFEEYERALHLSQDFIPENWRALRQMLIYHNMADLYEQMEEEDLARDYYDLAKEKLALQKRVDPLITDLSSYAIELLLSSANCFSNAEEFALAYRDLHLARELYQTDPPFQKEYVKARMAYISGLIFMNDGQEQKAEASFSKAFHQQKELVDKGLDKKEHLARSAYYLASLIEEENQKQALFELAGAIFRSVYEKEPMFYGSSLAEMENELGKMASNEKQAIVHYDRAIDGYKTILKDHPQDLFAKESLLVSRLNRLKYRKDQLSTIQKEMEELGPIDPLFMTSIIDYIHQQEVEPAFLKWLKAFEKKLPPTFDA